MTRDERETILLQATYADEHGDFDELEALCETLLAVKDSDINASELLRIHCMANLWLSRSNGQRGFMDAAIAYGETARKLATSLHDEQLYIQAILRNAWNYREVPDYNSADALLDEALALSMNIEYSWGIARVHVIRAWILIQKGMAEQALRDIAASRQTFEQLNDMFALGDTYSVIANCYIWSNNLTAALEHLGYALAIAEPRGYKTTLAYIYLRMHNVYLDLRESERALHYALKALEYYELIGAKTQIVTCLIEIGNTYTFLGNNQLALEYMLKGIAISEETHNQKNIRDFTMNIANVYLELGDYDNVIQYAKQGLALCDDPWSLKDSGVNLANIGIVYSKKEYSGYDLALAEEHLLRSVAVLTEIDNKNILYQIHEILMNFYAEHERWKEAFYHNTQYHIVKDEVQSESAIRKAHTVELERTISIERARAQATEELLHKTLPQSIADRVIKGETRIADHFESASVLFADVVGFTKISAKMPPAIVLGFMNFIFEEFDTIAAQYGCERIKTIGDGYMAVCGAPVMYPDHAERLACMALEMMEDIQLPEDIRKYLPAGTLFHLRIGLHCGEITAGLIGTGKLAYDIYGDAVNTASRMESHGEAGKIHVSEEFKHAVETQNIASLQFIERAEIDIKGKGMMKTYFLQKATT